MDPLMISLLVSLIGSGIGAAGSAIQNKKIDKFIDKRSSDIQSTFDKEYNTNIFDTAMGKSLVESLKNNFTTASKKVTGNSVVGGYSPEAKAGTMSKLKENFDNALLQLAGQGTQRKDMLTRTKDARLDNMAGVMLQNLIGKSQNWSNLGSNATNAGSSLAYAGAMDPNMFKPFAGIGANLGI